MRTLEPFYYRDNPWSAELKGKNVLLMHRFVDTIKCQLKTDK